MSDYSGFGFGLREGAASAGGVRFSPCGGAWPVLLVALDTGGIALVDPARLLWRAGRAAVQRDPVSGLIVVDGPGSLGLAPGARAAGVGELHILHLAPGRTLDVAAGALLAIAPRAVMSPIRAGDGSPMVRLLNLAAEAAIIALAGRGPLHPRLLDGYAVLDVGRGAVLVKDQTVALAVVEESMGAWEAPPSARWPLVQCSGYGTVGLQAGAP